jgi:hypothetical protein
MAVAMEQLASLDHDLINRYLQNTKDEKCGCWKEYGRGQEAAVTSWALLARANIQATPERDELTYMLKIQNPDGSWGITRTTGNSVDSAVYPTSRALLALSENGRKGRVSVERQNAVNQAIQEGVRFLVSARRPGKARWLDYPQADDGVESVSDSGLALHVLHRLGHVDPALDQLWLQTLPEPIGPIEAETSSHRVRLKDDYLSDDIRRFKLPWCLIATQDAYANGSRNDQLAAQCWVERMLANPSEIVRAVARKPHIAAEILISVRYLEGDINLL